MSIGILNLEGAVRPQGRSSEATPEEATARTIFFSDRIFVINAFHINVLLVPPWPYTKKNPGLESLTFHNRLKNSFLIDI